MTDEDADREDQESGKSSETAGLRNMLARHNNDAMALAAELYNQTYALREQRRSLRKENEALKQKLPAEGSVVLSGDDVKLWESYQGLGKPEDLQSQLSDAKRERRQALLTRAAVRHGFKEKLLAKLLEGTEIDVRDKDGDDEFIVGEGDKAKPITDLVETDWKEFADALVGSKQSGRTAVGQAGAREDGKADYVGNYLSRVQPKAGKEA